MLIVLVSAAASWYSSIRRTVLPLKHSTMMQVSRFAYIWISMMCISTFVTPALWLAGEHPYIEAIKARVALCLSKLTINRASLEEQDTYSVTLEHAGRVQEEAASIMVQVITSSVFGCLVPPLMLLLPVMLWSQLCACQLFERIRVASCGQEFSLMLASNILVQKPLSMLRHLYCALSIIINIWIFVDLSFGWAAITLYMILNLVTFTWSTVACRKIKQQLLRPHVIDFVGQSKFGTSGELIKRIDFWQCKSTDPSLSTVRLADCL